MVARVLRVAALSAAWMLCLSTPVRAGSLEWVEVDAAVLSNGDAQVTYQTRWLERAGGMHGFYFQGAVGSPHHFAGVAELPDGSRVPLAIQRLSDKWDIVLSDGRAWGPGEASGEVTIAGAEVINTVLLGHLGMLPVCTAVGCDTILPL